MLGQQTRYAMVQAKPRLTAAEVSEETPGSLATVAWLVVAMLEIAAIVALGAGLFVALAMFGWLGGLLTIGGFIVLRAAQSGRERA